MAKVEPRIAAQRVTVYPLDATLDGERTSEGFAVRLTADAPWFEVVVER